MNNSKSGFSTTSSVLLLALISILFISGPSWSEVVFEDNFAGTVIDPAKWQTRTPCAYSDADCGAYASVSQNESLQLTVTRGNYVFAQAVSTMKFNNTVTSFECETWQDETSSWQDYPFVMITPLGGFAYYNIWHWQIDWRDKNGVPQTNHSLSMPAMEPWQHFKLKIQLSGNELQWLYDLGDGSGHQLAFSTTDFSLPYPGNSLPAEDIGKLIFSISDQRTTYVDNVRVQTTPLQVPTCDDCGSACDPEANGYQLVENLVGEQTTRFDFWGATRITDEYWFEAGDMIAFGEVWDFSGAGKVWITSSGPRDGRWQSVWESENYGEWIGYHTCNDFFGGFGPGGPMVGQAFTVTGELDVFPLTPDLPDLSCYDVLWTGNWVARAIAPCSEDMNCAVITFDVTGAIYARLIDADGDGVGPCNDCDDNDSSVYPEAPELCDGKDNNCDTVIPADEMDSDGDGFMTCDGDCDDLDYYINPDAYELPGNTVDENCDGSLGACDPGAEWKNHGQFVRCVAHEVDALIEASILTEEEGDALITSAAQSDVGKK